MPPIFSSKSVSPTARWIISFVPIANSPTRRAPSSVSSRDEQRVLAEARRGVDDDARLEAQAHVAALAAVVQRGHAERDLALDRALRRRAEDLAVGQVRLAGAGLPGAPLDVDAQVGAGGRDVQLAHAGEPLDQAGVALAQLAPGGDRVGLVEQQRRVDEALPGTGAHARGLRAERGRIGGADPAQLAGGLALVVAGHPRRLPACVRGVALGGDVGALGRVDARPHEQPAIEALDALELGRVEVGDLVVVAVRAGRSLERPLGRHGHAHARPAAPGLARGRDGQRRALRRRADEQRGATRRCRASARRSAARSG